jgi:hypothetical protein
MPTERKVIVAPGGGGDYLNLAAAEAAERAIGADLVSRDEIMIFECENGNAGTVGFPAAWITDATRWIQVRSAAGHGHEGIWDTAKAHIKVGASGNGIGFSSKHLRVKRMAIWTEDSAGAEAAVNVGQSCTRLNVNECILRGGVWNIYTSNATAVWEELAIDSTLLYGPAAYCINFVNAGAGSVRCTLRNCTLIGNTYAIRSNDTDADFESVNCYFRGTTATWLLGGGATAILSANCATADALAPSAGLRNIAYDGTTFISTTSGSENLHLAASGSPLEDAGDDAHALGFPLTDYEGGERRGTADIGADDPSAAPDSVVPSAESAFGRNLIPTLRVTRRGFGFF